MATFYPDPSLRGYGDIDLLVEDAQGAQEALLRAGFEPVGDPSLYVDLHHLRPLTTKGLPIRLEIHSEPKWVDGLRAPSAADVLEGAVLRV